MNLAEHVLGATETLVTGRQPPSPLGAATAPEHEASRQRNRATLRHMPEYGWKKPRTHPQSLQTRRALGSVFF